MRFLHLLASLFLLILPSPLDSTPSHSQHGNLIQSATQSQSFPALLVHASIESRPDPALSSLAVALPVVSESNENSGKPAKEKENKSADELKGDLYHANTEVKEWKDRVNAANHSYQEQLEKQKQAKLKIERMEKDYKDLDRESDRVREAWENQTANAKKTRAAFQLLERELKSANDSYNSNMAQVEAAQKEEAKEQKNLDELKEKPNKKANLEKTIAEMTDAVKQKLANEVTTLNEAVTTATNEQRKRQSDVNLQKTKMKNCRDGDSRPMCDINGRLATLQRELETAEEATTNATNAYNVQNERLEKFDVTKRQLQRQLLVFDLPTPDEITTAEGKVKKFKDRVTQFNGFAGQDSDLVANITSQISAMQADYDQAVEVLKTTQAPPEVDAASQKATSAKSLLEDAKEAYNKMDGEIEPYLKTYKEALRSLKQAKEEAEIVQKQYDAAMLREKGLSTGATGGIVGGILVIIVVSLAIGFGVCYMRKIYVFKPKNNDKNTGASNNSIGRKQAIAAKVLAAKALEPQPENTEWKFGPTPGKPKEARLHAPHEPTPKKPKKGKKRKTPLPEDEEESSAPPLVLEDTQPDSTAPANPPAPAPASARTSPSARDFNVGVEHVGVIRVGGEPETPAAPAAPPQDPPKVIKESVITTNEQGNTEIKC